MILLMILTTIEILSYTTIVYMILLYDTYHYDQPYESNRDALHPNQYLLKKIVTHVVVPFRLLGELVLSV
jgi:hypothetical protein